MSQEKESQTSGTPVPGVYALLAEYHDPDSLIAAAKKVRDKGYQRWDCYSPFPVHGIDPAMGIKRTRLPWITLCLGLTGTTTAFTVQWWTNAVDYKWTVSGKPLWSFAANVPIGFELSVLFAAITTFLSMLLLNGLPRLSSPLDHVKRFLRASDDKFFIVIESADPKFDEKATRTLLDETHADAVEAVPTDDHLSSDRIPSGIIYTILIAIAVSLIPFGLFASARNSLTTNPPYNIVSNMDYQAKYKAQRKNDFFKSSDSRAMRMPVEGTVAVGDLRDDAHFYEGKDASGAFARTFPSAFTVDDAAIARGQERFGIYCTPCHGQTGDGDGMVHRHAFALQEGTWVKPTNIADPKIADKSVGELFNTISNGIRNMPGYARQVPPADRWAIILYVRALQKSQAEFVASATEPTK
ncbi:MAG TPA: quinol:electron acceptor oxidoreductase subunit ActD [Polyangiaceae bacterium]|jgi:mono/diheme cytochrome c family protein|nr:quinol:electron acceptor oxidoreductase subunit ActD [Polyangiaceae bacterium]